MDTNNLKLIKDMQEVVKQMLEDDLSDNPDSANEYFECDCCAKTKALAGSVLYSNNYRLCNDCVLLAEVSFALKKINDIQDLLDNMEDSRLGELCDYIRKEETKDNN